MKNLISVLIITLLATNCLAADTTLPSSSSADPIGSSSTPSEQSSTQTPVPTTVEPTTMSSKQPTSTEPSTTTSTEPPTTTSTEPPTTTSTEPPTTTPTVPPTTTSTEPPTTLPPTSTVAPSTTKSPNPEEGSWNVTSGNTTCIKAVLAVLFKISIENGTENIQLPSDASSARSTCNGPNGTQLLILTDSSFELQFTFENDSSNVYVRNISFTYMGTDPPETVTNDNRMFSVKAGNSYMCTTVTDVILSNVTMEIYKIHVQAFRNATNEEFGTVEECDADNPVNDIVPIAVGVALLALVVVVLIAYLVGRRRSRQRGYQSV